MFFYFNYLFNLHIGASMFSFLKPVGKKLERNGKI